MADQKPVDSTQITLDKKATSASAASAATSGTSSMGCLVFKIVAVLFVIGNVTALYVLHFVNRPSPTTRFSFSNFAAVDGTKAKVGDVVSLSAESKLRNGAGTTAYLNRATLSDSNVAYYEYINVAKLGTTQSTYLTNLMSYRRVMASGSKESVLTTFTVDPATKAVSISDAYDKSTNVVTGNAIRGIATLSDTTALVLTIDDSTFTYKTSVTSATLSATGVTLAKDKSKLVATGSSANFVTPLNSNSAIVAYFDPWVSQADYYQKVTVATVAADGTVSLSPPKNFGPANNDNTFYVNWGRPVTTSAADGSFAIPYYTPTSGLCLTMSSYSTSTQTVANFTDGVCNTKVKPVYFPESIMLSDSLMLIAFHDSTNNNVLTLVTATVTGRKAYFRSSFLLSEVAGAYDFGTAYGFSPDVSLSLLSGNRVAVSFLNPSMNGRQSVKIVKYSIDSLSFKDVTPVLPMAASSFTLSLNGGAVNKAVTQRVLAVGADSVVAMHMGARGAATYQQVALVENFGSPVGVLRDLHKSKASVAISGKASNVQTAGKGDLVEGQFYYATTAGYVASPAAGTVSGAEVFTTSEDVNMLVTADSKVGLATDDDELFVSTAF